MRIEIRDVRLIDGLAETAREHVDVTVDGDRISAIEAHDPTRSDVRDSAGAPPTRIDGAGRTLLPGLIDAHAHYTFDPTEGSIGTILGRSDAEIVLAAAGHAATALRAGVTTSRGAGSLRNLEVALRDAIEAGHLPGPRILTAGTAVGITGGHGYQFGLEADDPASFVTATRRVVRDGADVVKVIASEAAMLTTTGLAASRVVNGGPELTFDELRAVVETATELGVKVMSHAQDAESVRRSATAGVASVEHAWLADRPALEALAASGAYLVPTMVVVDVNRTLGGLTPVQRERQDMIERRQRESTETAIELGIPVATGTDTGEVGVTADMVWREIVLLHDHGASAMAAIKAATSAGARLLGLEADLGTVEVGKLADLVLVDGDPTTDLRRLATPLVVIRGGEVVASA
ncbi:MAG TPA: amidohydrolase family protein [Candidatus Limnocylindrales bacterium]